MSCRKSVRLMVTATTMTDGKEGLKERIRLLAKRPKTTAGIALVVVLVTAAAVGCTFTGADRPEEPEKNAALEEETPPEPVQDTSREEPTDPATERTAELPQETVTELAEQLKGDMEFLRQLDGYDPAWNNAISFGGGWVDGNGRAHLEFRAGCLWPSILMEAVLEKDSQGGWALVSVAQAPGQWVAGTPEGTALSAEELEQWNDWLWTDATESTAIRIQFLTSIYRSPQEIDLFQLFYNGCADGGYTNAQWTEPSRAETEEVMGGPVHIDSSKTTRAEMDACLQTYLGLGL